MLSAEYPACYALSPSDMSGDVHVFHFFLQKITGELLVSVSNVSVGMGDKKKMS